MSDEFLGRDNWQPQGFVSPGDEQAMQEAYLRGPRMAREEYAYNTLFTAHADKADESFNGSTFQYIPTEIEVGAAIALRNMGTAGELPIQENAPGMAQLLQGIYKSTAAFWQDIRNASGTGW